MSFDPSLQFESFQPCPLLAPVPAVLISCAGQDGKPNLITIAWAGTVCSDPPMVQISVRKERYSYRLLRETGEFVINLVGTKQAWATDYCGVKSGRDVDKFAQCQLTPISAPPLFHAPAVGECPAHMMCKVEQVIPLGSHDLFLARVVGVRVQKSLLDEKGSLHLERAGLVCYNHGVYQAAGEVLGFFGYSVAGEKVLKSRMAAYRTAKEKFDPKERKKK